MSVNCACNPTGEEFFNGCTACLLTGWVPGEPPISPRFVAGEVHYRAVCNFDGTFLDSHRPVSFEEYRVDRLTPAGAWFVMLSPYTGKPTWRGTKSLFVSPDKSDAVRRLAWRMSRWSEAAADRLARAQRAEVYVWHQLGEEPPQTGRSSLV